MIHRRANSISKSRRGDDEPIQTQRDFDGVGPQTTKDFYYHQDELFNVVAITAGQNGTTLPRHTGVYNTGDIIERIKYGDYGNPTVMQGASGTIAFTSLLGNRFMFTGREYDGETQFSYYRTRYLEHEWGRFTTRDTIGVWGDAANLGGATTYTAASPSMHVDPSGMISSLNIPSLLAAGYTAEEIAALLGVSVSFVYTFIAFQEQIQREAQAATHWIDRLLHQVTHQGKAAVCSMAGRMYSDFCKGSMKPRSCDDLGSPESGKNCDKFKTNRDRYLACAVAREVLTELGCGGREKNKYMQATTDMLLGAAKCWLRYDTCRKASSSVTKRELSSCTTQ